MKPIDIADEREKRLPHKTGRAGCESCCHQWRAVCPEDVSAKLECPKCHTFSGWFHGEVPMIDKSMRPDVIQDERASIPYGRVLTTKVGFRVVCSPPGDALQWAYVTNVLGERVYIYANNNLYLTLDEQSQ